MEIDLPHNFTARTYQEPLLSYIEEGGKRAFCLWHRRSGKDLTLWNLIISEAIEFVGLYYYLLPTFTQAKKIIWDGITNDGLKFVDCIPEKLIKHKNGSEMKIELINGSIIQLIGTDNYDSIRGTNPRGCVFSEYAFQNPMAWEVVKPILKVNRGWAVFNTTPNGKNHAHDLFQMAKESSSWFCEKLSITDTNILTEQDMQEERDEGMSEEMIQQEYYCSFSIGAMGAYYAKYITKAEEEVRICNVPVEPNLPVHMVLDLGRNDSTAIIFTQWIGKELRIVDFFEHNGESVGYYCKELDKKDYRYGTMYLPHDAEAKRMESQKTIQQQFQDAGFHTEIVDKLEIKDGIQLARKIFPKIWFDKTKCKPLIKALENYHKEWDEVKKVFKVTPLHDWSSHACLIGSTKVRTDRGEVSIEDVKIGDMVETPNGLARVSNAGPVKRTSDLIELTLSDNKKVVMTSDHKVFTERGLVYADALRYNDVVLNLKHQLCKKKQSNSMERSIGFRDSIIARMNGGNQVQATCIEQYGNTTRGIYQKVIAYITSMGTRLTTILKTLSVSRSLNTYPFMQSKVSGLEVKPIKNNLNRYKDSRKSGTEAKLVDYGISNMVRMHGSIGNGMRKIVLNVAGLLKRHILRGQNTVTRIVNSKHLGEEGECQWVYDLTVEKEHCYLANGILVSNSDAFRYLAVAYNEPMMIREVGRENFDKFDL